MNNYCKKEVIYRCMFPLQGECKYYLKSGDMCRYIKTFILNRSIAVYDDVKTLMRIHGHDGKTFLKYTSKISN